MQKLLSIFPVLLVTFAVSIATPAAAFAGNNENLPDDKKFPTLLSNSAQSPVYKQFTNSIYNTIGLLSYGLDKDVFYNAYKGYEYLLSKGKLKKKHILTICDYSKSSTTQRLFVIDLKQQKVLFNTFVSHGKNSGDEFATSFSNLENSNKSSLGFLITGETYTGKAGLSMRFNGAEKGINDRVRSRDIVLHGSVFVSRSLQGGGVISKSLGCPAVPFGVHKKIIDEVKGGSCFYIHSPDMWYAKTSTILNAPLDFINENSRLALNPAALTAIPNTDAGDAALIQPY